MQDKSGEKLYEAVQKAVDDARAEGVDYVYVMGHIGMEESTHPWTYADVISHTNGIDVFLDGHSHDMEQVIMKNKDGEDVVRTACGTKMQAIGYSMISAKDGVTTTNIWKWSNKETVPELLDIHNEMNGPLDDVMRRIAERTETVIANALPGEFGGFLHVSGLSYEIDVSVPSGCIENENGLMTGIEGERRVRNILVNGEPIDPEKTYTVSGNDYTLLNNGDGQTAFNGAEVINNQFKLDSQLLIDYIIEDLNGTIGEEYADPYGQGRITITE